MIHRSELIRQIETPFQIAIEDLKLEHLWIIYPVDQKYALDSKIIAILLEEKLQLSQTGLAT